MLKRLKHLFSSKENLPNVILLGIGASSYALAQVLIEQREAKIAAPSDLVALIERRGVTQVIGFMNDFQLTQDVLKEVESTRANLLMLDKSLTVKQWLEQL